jgi:hypothetical protein
MVPARDVRKERGWGLVRINPLVRLGELTFSADDDTLAREVHDLLDPAATVRLNGSELDGPGYLRHVFELRSTMSGGTIAIVDEIQDDRGPAGAFAARVVVRMKMKDGSLLTGESHLVGRAGDDGRVTRMVEIGRLLEDSDSPAEAGPTTAGSRILFPQE